MVQGLDVVHEDLKSDCWLHTQGQRKACNCWFTPGGVPCQQLAWKVHASGAHEPEGITDGVCAGRAGRGCRVQRPAQAMPDADRAGRAVGQDARHQERAEPARSTPRSACTAPGTAGFSLL